MTESKEAILVKNLSELKNEVGDTKEKINMIEEQISKTNSELKNYTNNLQAIIEENKREIKELKEKSAAQINTIESLKSQLKTIKTDMKNMEDKNNWRVFGVLTSTIAFIGMAVYYVKKY